MNENLVDKNKIREYKESIGDTAIKRELEYLLVILEKCLEYEKPKLLAKLYIVYIDKKIDWDTFCAYSVVIEKIIIYDIAVLMQFRDKCGLRKDEINDISAILRLSSLGLIEIANGQSVFTRGNISGVAFNVYNYDYMITKFGDNFVKNM